MENKKIIKNYIHVALTSSFSSALIYLSFAFLTLEINPLDWEGYVRFMFVFSLVVSTLISLLIVNFLDF
jgi:hypothetical protein